MINVLRAAGLAAALALAPLVASAGTVNPGSNIAVGDSVDVLGDSYFYSEAFAIGESGATYEFTFTNTSDSLAAITFFGMDVLQRTAEFVDGITFEFDDIVTEFAQGESSGANLSTTLAAGESATLTITFGNIVNSGPAGGQAQLAFAVEAAVIPVPAAGLLLLTALGGVAALRRRKTA